MDWEREKTYIFDRGREQKAVEDAVIAVKKFHIPIDDVAREYGVDKSEIESRLQPAPAN